MMKTFKLLGLLLTYPKDQLQAVVGSFTGVFVEEGILTKRQIKSLQPLMDDYANNDLIELQEEYVNTFDRSRNHSLYLFEHIHGESRDRGAAMVDMKEMYATKGLHISSNELPDYLPVFLEYLSYCGASAGRRNRPGSERRHLPRALRHPGKRRRVRQPEALQPGPGSPVHLQI